MAQILLRMSEGQKALWVEAAFEERLSLSEWIRRRCDAGLGAGAVSEDAPGGPVGRRPDGLSRSVTSAAPAPSPALDAVSPDRAQGVRMGKAAFRPDPKVKK